MAIRFYVSRVFVSFREVGIAATLRHVWETIADRSFDRKYGTETGTFEDLSTLDIGSDSEQHATHYSATRARPFQRMIKHLDLPRDATFVDIGSGKGRVLLLALENGFKHVRGIEFSQELCDISEENMKTFRAKTGNEGTADIICADATKYDFTPDERVYYMGNPFDDVVMDQIVDRLCASLRRHPREIWLIYYNPLYRDPLDAAEEFRHVADERAGVMTFAVYRAGAPAAMARVVDAEVA